MERPPIGGRMRGSMEKRKMDLGTPTEKRTKTAYLELLRIIACFFVIVNHTNSGIFLSRTPESKLWWISLAYFFACKTAVPVFVMISGALLLGKTDDSRKHLSRILRIVAVILVFSFLYYARSMYMAGRPVNLLEYFKIIYQRHITNAYWYLYLYLGILLTLPFWQILSVHMKRREFRLLIVISVVIMGGAPVLIHYVPGLAFSYMFTEPFFSVYIGMLFLGYYLERYVEKKKRYALLSAVIFLGGVAAEVCLTYREYRAGAENMLFLEDRTFLNISVTAAALFYLARYLGDIVKAEWFWNAVVGVGGCSFGIYLFSDLFVSLYEKFYYDLSVRMNSMAAVLIYEILVFVSALAVTVALKKIPYVKKIV